jgi:hypothetical protein
MSIFSSSGYMPRSGSAELSSNSVFILRTSILFLQQLHHFTSSQQCLWILTSSPPCQHLFSLW